MDVYDDEILKNETEANENFTPKQEFSKNQKIAVAILGIFSILVITLWAVQLKSSINRPFFSSSEDVSTSSLGTCSGPDCLGSEEFLKTIDTDKDGLFDWDELNLYMTSPYLEDSDSDGLTDKKEVDTGTDPNCPLGRDCSSDISSGENGSGDNSPSGSGEKLSIPEGAGTLTEGEILNDILNGQGDASILREMLLQAGMDKETLDKISDEDLMASYKEVLNN